MISENSNAMLYGAHVSSSWWGMHVIRVSANKAYKNIFLQEFPILLALNYYTFLFNCDFYRYEHILRKEGNFKAFWKAGKFYNWFGQLLLV